MSEWVLDASAALAVLKREPGEDRVTEALGEGAVISAVNLSEVVAKLAGGGMPESEIRADIRGLRMDVAPFDADAAFAAGLLIPLTRSAGLSLGDRACIALGQRRGLPVLTADAAWAGLGLGVTERVWLGHRQVTTPLRIRRVGEHVVHVVASEGSQQQAVGAQLRRAIHRASVRQAASRVPSAATGPPDCLLFSRGDRLR